MVLNNNKLKKIIELLDPTIKKRIVINNGNFYLEKSNFINYINNPDIKKLDDKLNKGCIKDNSLYILSEKRIVDGFEVCVLNNTNIYRTYLGFLNKDIQNNYVRKDIIRPIYFGNKYFCYAIARTIWGGINSYKITKEIILIDLFNENNIKKLIELIEKLIKDTIIRDKLIHLLKITTGYSMNFDEQLQYYINRIPKNWNIDLYTNCKIKSSYLYCKSEKNNLNPQYCIDKDSLMHILFDYIISNIKNIDGLILKQIPTNFMIGGLYDVEEIILKGNTFLEKLNLDKNDKICWVNYNLKNNLNFDNIHLKFEMYRLQHLLITHNKQPNENFSLFQFYKNNRLKYHELNKDKKYILSYNLHYFNNLSFYIDIKSNIKNILRFIKHYKNNLEICFFQEVSFKNKLDYNYFILEMAKIGFKYFYKALNGGRNLYIYCFTKNKYNYQIIKTNNNLSKNEKNIVSTFDIYPDYSKLEIERNHILLHYNSIKICSVHLNIGYRLKMDESKNIKIVEFNSLLRINELSKIIKYKPDMIIGDFNFTPNSNENIFLLKNNYYLLNKSDENSTPYNRVDNVYYNKNIKLDNILVKCNYSDHLPLFQEIP
jgi:endonuclease/exonuclease/phosphatase family metal-dependent hydrolase